VTQPPRPAFLRAPLAGIDRPLLHVVVDTEEEFDWSAPFARSNTAVSSIGGLHRGHALFRRFGIVPAYLLDHPVAIDRLAADTIGPWVEEGSCLIGSQLHSWVTPPFEEVVCPFHSFPCNLTPDLERRKLQVLTDRITEALGVRPRIYKAGRYGLDVRREAMLRELGYVVDTSVVPYRSYAGLGGGPDFFGFPDQPFWLGPDRGFLYLPNTHSLIGPLRAVLGGRVVSTIYRGMGPRVRLPGLLARLRLLERISLTPEGVSLDEMCRLTESLHALGHRVFALSLHSPSLMPGGTPYARTSAEADQLIERTERFLEFFFGKLGGQATTAIDLLHRFNPQAAAQPALHEA
jgi:hypothetical protein